MAKDDPFFICSKCGQLFEPWPSARRRPSLRCRSCIVAYERQRRADHRAQGTWDPKPRRQIRGPMTEAAKAKRRVRIKEVYRLDADYRRRVLVRSMTRHAVKIGKLVRQPCEVCGTSKSEAHHDDYSRPLDVRWLCRRHHHDHHNAMRELQQKAA